MRFSFLHLEEVSSTQTYIKDRLSSYEEEAIFCVSAKKQTAAYGTRGRKWHAPRGKNIYASLYFTVDKKRKATSFAQLMAVAIAEVLHSKGVPAKVKWPNDVLLGGKKCAGVLVELVSVGEKWAVILGFGINLFLSSLSKKSIDQEVTSLEEWSGVSWNPKELLLAVVEDFLDRLLEVEKYGEETLMKQLKKRALFLGEKILFHDGTRVYEGRLTGFSKEGALELEDKRRNTLTFFSGKIIQTNLPA